MYRILRYVPADEAGRRSQKRYPLVVQQSIRISDHCIRSGGSHGLVAMVASMAFMSVMYFFNICFDKVGSYLMLIFMVLQLGGSAGTYPLELSSDFYHKIHERMPFTYSVKAFRSTISTGQDISGEMAVFIGMIVVFNLLSLAVFVYKTKKGKNMISAEVAVES